MTKTPPSARLRQKWLDALLPMVVFDGWTQTAADTAAVEAGLTQNEQALAAPGGVMDLLHAYFDDVGEQLKTRLESDNLADLGITAKVTRGVELWLEILEPNKEAVRKAATRAFVPWRTPPALSRAWSVADIIWTGTGDTATDYNKYSKRGLLASVLPRVIMKWVDEPEGADMAPFIEARLREVMKAGQFGSRFAKPVLDRIWPSKQAS